MARLSQLTMVAALAVNAPLLWALKPGEPASGFKGTDSVGKTESLAQYRGK